MLILVPVVLLLKNRQVFSSHVYLRLWYFCSLDQVFVIHLKEALLVVLLILVPAVLFVKKHWEVISSHANLKLWYFFSLDQDLAVRFLFCSKPLL